MSRSYTFLFALLALMLVPLAATAQEEEAAPPYVYGTYFECDVNDQWRADEIAKSLFAPVYDAAVDDGTILGWGYLGHHTGGKWRRVLWHAAADTDKLLDASDAVSDKIQETNARANQEFGKICDTHEDYIWRFSTGSGEQAIQERGEAGFSAYYVCDMSKQDRADELLKEVFEPVYNRQVTEGNLISWGWMEHWVGGKYRRLETMTAVDHKTLLKARDAAIEEFTDKHKEATDEFDSICGSHSDYMWNILMEKP
jgi:hypothetical protein